MEIKERIKEALIARDMTASDLARKSGLNKGAISKYHKGDVIPKQTAIGQMAEALHVSPSWLMGYDVPMESQSQRIKADLEKRLNTELLNAQNYAKLIGYYEALLESQKEKMDNMLKNEEKRA